MKKMQFVSWRLHKIHFNKEERTGSKEEGSERKGKKIGGKRKEREDERIVCVCGGGGSCAPSILLPK